MTKTQEAFTLIIQRKKKTGQLDLFEDNNGEEYIYHCIASNIKVDTTQTVERERTDCEAIIKHHRQ